MPSVELHRLVEQVLDATVLVDAHGQVEHFNRHAVDLLGVSGPGPRQWKLCAIDRTPLLTDPVQRAIDAGQPLTERLLLRLPGSVYREVQLRVVPLGPVGVGGALLTFVEVAPEASDELEEYRRYFELSDDILALATNDGNVLRINAGAIRVLGWSSEAWLGTRGMTLVHPDDRQRAFETLTSSNTERDVILRFRHADGRWRLISLTVQHEHSVAFGDLVFLRGVDVTEKLRQQDQLMTSREQLAEAQEIAKIGTVMRDLRTGVMEQSAQFRRMLELPEGVDAMEVVLPRMSQSDQDRLVAAIDQADHGAASTIAVQIRLSTGVRDFRVWARPLRAPTGEVARTLVVVQDVTDEQRLSAQLRSAERTMALGTLAAGVAHEINNPLAYILGNLNAVRHDLARFPAIDGVDLPDLRAAMDEAITGAERVRDIVGGLRAFTTADDRTRTSCDVRRVLETVLSLTRSETRTHASLETDLPPVPTVHANEARLGQLFLNLVLNAAQAMTEGGPTKNVLRLAARAEAGEVVVTVSDTGVGIAPEHLPRIFDPFFTTRGPGVGSGLGLFVAQGVARELGGSIRCEPNAPRGTVFTVTLPAELELAQPVVPVTERPRRVLVIDDEPMILRTVRRLLKSHHLACVASAREALEVLEAQSFDVILCDVMMPEVSGLEFFERLDDARRKSVVFMTGGSTSDEVTQFLERTRARVLNKPFDGTTLGSAIAAVAQTAQPATEER